MEFSISTRAEFATNAGKSTNAQEFVDNLRRLRSKTSSRPRSVSHGAWSVKQRHSSITSGAR